MKSLLKTTKKVERRRFQGMDLRTNVSFLLKVDDHVAIGRKDAIIGEAIHDAMTHIETHGLKVGKISVVVQGKTLKIWVQTEKSLRFPDENGQLTKRISRNLRISKCWSCDEWTYEIEEFHPAQHGKQCALVLAHNVIES